MQIDSITVKEAFGQRWTDVNGHIDIGAYPGMYRGYNLEFRDDNNNVEYADMVLISGELDSENPNFQMEFQSHRHIGHEFTGRAVFRGYYTGDYSQNSGMFTPVSKQAFDIFYEDVMSGGVEDGFGNSIL